MAVTTVNAKDQVADIGTMTMDRETATDDDEKIDRLEVEAKEKVVKEDPDEDVPYMVFSSDDEEERNDKSESEEEKCGSDSEEESWAMNLMKVNTELLEEKISREVEAGEWQVPVKTVKARRAKSKPKMMWRLMYLSSQGHEQLRKWLCMNI